MGSDNLLHTKNSTIRGKTIIKPYLLSPVSACRGSMGGGEQMGNRSRARGARQLGTARHHTRAS